jgi:neutral ceramidase
MGADENPSPRGTLLDAKRHGLELAGAVTGVLNRPMRPVRGPVRLAYAKLELPLEKPPTQEQLEKDAKGEDVHIRNRALAYLELLKGQKPLPATVELPLGVVRLGDDLSFVAMGGEVVVDYAVRFKRMFAADHPWLIGYAYDVPCYIPSVRILKEGGYEAQQSLIYYGVYGPFRPQVEEIVVTNMNELVASVRGH